MDADDLARALSAEPPTAPVRADAVHIIVRSVASAKRRRARAAVAASVSAVIVVVAVVTGSIAAFSGHADPAPQPAHVTATISVPTGSTVSNRLTPTPSSPPKTTTTRSAPTRATSGRATPTAPKSAPTIEKPTASRPLAGEVGDAPTGKAPATSVGSPTTRLSTRIDSPSVDSPPSTEPGTTAASLPPQPNPAPVTEQSTRQQKSPGSSSAVASTTTTTQAATSAPTVTETDTSTSTPTSSTGSSPAPTASQSAGFAQFVGTYNHHTSFLVIKADHTGTIAQVFGCCQGTTYPLRFTTASNMVQGVVTGPPVLVGTGGSVHMTVGQQIDFQFVAGQRGPILQSSGFPSGSDQIWCGAHYDDRCGA